VDGAYWPIDRVQKMERKSIVAIAKEFANRGLSIHSMADELELNYSSLKRALRLRKYQHPVGIALIDYRCQSEIGVTLNDYLVAMIAKGESRNAIAKDLGVDNKTLQAYADKHGLVFPFVKPVPHDFTNIIAAIKRRKRKPQPLIDSGAQNGIPCSTIKKRIALGWNSHEILGIPAGCGHIRRQPLSKGMIVKYVGIRHKTLAHGELVMIVGGTREPMLIVESINNVRRAHVSRKNISIAN